MTTALAHRLAAELLEAAPDAIIAIDQDGRIVLANAQTERLFGYPRRELVGEFVEILLPAMGAGVEVLGQRRGGSTFAAEISLSQVTVDGRELVAAAIRDVTERTRAQAKFQAERDSVRMEAEQERFETRLQQSQRLEILGQLAGGVAHDFNNLLAVILNYAAFVNEEVTAAAGSDGGGRWEAVRHDVSQIERAAERAARLTRQLLAFARREVVSPQVINLNDIIGDLEQLLRRTIGEHLELVTNLAPNLWPILADSGQMEQALVNLAVNGRDAMLGGGTLTIETENLLVDDAHRAGRPELSLGRYVRVQVSDTGTGMAKEVRERAFEPFYTTKPKGEGSGLGLATVYGVVSQAGGYVQIYSEPGIGTTFTALLPATEGSPDSATVAMEGLALAAGGTVLVVEDEEAMREVTRRILVRNGYRVVVAASGREAIDVVKADTKRIDLLLTDVVMPQMLGRELADRITALRPDMRVLFMSGYAPPVLGAKGTLEAGVRLVQKPFSEVVLLAKVRDALTAPAAQPC